MKRLIKAIEFNSNNQFEQRPNLAPRENYYDYAATYRLLLMMYKHCISDPAMEDFNEPHGDFFTQYLADLAPMANPIELLRQKKSLILYGVPGTGKTRTAMNLAGQLLRGNAPEQPAEDSVKVIQFHPGYSYANFIIGISPTVTNGQVTYETKAGILYDRAKIAQQKPNQDFVLIIDEINRANLPEVLGEVMYCLEYRGEQGMVSLPHIITFPAENDPFQAGHRFYIPENLYIIGTMNHVDRSISGFDMALRRRFAWFKLEPMTWLEQKLRDENPQFEESDLNDFLNRAVDLNNAIASGDAPDANQAEPRIPLNTDHQIGDSYFYAIKDIVTANNGQPRRILPQHRERLWLYFLQPLLEDYLGNDVHLYRDALKRLGESFSD